MSRGFLLTLSAIALLTSVLTGCGSNAAPSTPAPAAAPAAAATEMNDAAPPPSYPLTVTDATGETITIPAAPERVVSLAPSNTEIVFALEKGDLLVGRTEYCNYPAEAASVPAVGGLTDPNLEAIAAAGPDLILISPMSMDFRDSLQDLGVPVLVLAPQNLDEVYAAIETVGQVLNAPDQAAKVVQTMQEEVAAVTAQVAALPEEEKPRVFYEVWNEPLMTAGPGTFIHDLVELAGAVNVGGSATERWAPFSLEALVEADPDIILTPLPQTLADLEADGRPGWEDLAAVRTGRVYLVENGDLLARPGPRLVGGLKWLARTFHPDRFPGEGE